MTIQGAHVRQINEGGRGKDRVICARTSPLAAVLVAGRGRSSFTAKDVEASGAKFTKDQIVDAIRHAVNNGRIKRVARGVYRLVGEV